MKRKASTNHRRHASWLRLLAVPGEKLRVVIGEQEIRKRVRELARAINRDYAGRTLHVVGVLDKSFLFMADLVRQLTMPVQCHFVKAEIHDRSEGGIATRVITFVPRIEAAGKDILLVDAVLQSGLTLDHLHRYLLAQGAASVRTALLVEKSDERKVEVATDYVGFRTTAMYLVGYGLGYQARYRNLPFVARLNQG